MGTELKMQPTLMHVPTPADIVYTPLKLALDMVNFFKPSGHALAAVHYRNNHIGPTDWSVYRV